MIKYTVSILALLSTVSSLHGAALLTYDFSGDSLNPTATANPALVTGGTLTNANLGLFRIYDLSSVNQGQWVPPSLQTRPRANTVDLATAVANNINFSITINPAAALDLTSLAFELDNSNSAYPSGVAVRSSLTGTTNLFHQTVADPRITPGFYSVDLSAHEEFVGLDEAVTFSFYIYQVAGFSTVTVEWDNIVFSGGAAAGVPEPGAPLLLGTASVILALKRRRRA